MNVENSKCCDESTLKVQAVMQSYTISTAARRISQPSVSFWSFRPLAVIYARQIYKILSEYGQFSEPTKSSSAKGLKNNWILNDLKKLYTEKRYDTNSSGTPTFPEEGGSSGGGITGVSTFEIKSNTSSSSDKSLIDPALSSTCPASTL
nr:hypothetical protein Iba_chr08cCG10420 [Ipomoea batatas]